MRLVSIVPDTDCPIFGARCNQLFPDANVEASNL